MLISRKLPVDVWEILIVQVPWEFTVPLPSTVDISPVNLVNATVEQLLVGVMVTFKTSVAFAAAVSSVQIALEDDFVH